MSILKQKITAKSLSNSDLLIFGTIAVILLDQTVKYKIRQISGFYICNNGISFGIFIYPIIYWLILGIFLFLSHHYYKVLTKNITHINLFFALILGGVLSNGLDRLFFNCVFDYISIYPPLPIFNLADIFIFTGSSLLLISLLLKKEL